MNDLLMQGQIYWQCQMLGDEPPLSLIVIPAKEIFQLIVSCSLNVLLLVANSYLK